MTNGLMWKMKAVVCPPSGPDWNIGIQGGGGWFGAFPPDWWKYFLARRWAVGIIPYSNWTVSIQADCGGSCQTLIGRLDSSCSSRTFY